METFFSGCPHYHHSNIIKYCFRPFKTVEEMNSAMIDGWNERIKPKDTAYILGDFVFVPKGTIDKRAFISKIIKQLNGNIHFISGNHDEDTVLCKDLFKSYHNPYLEIKVNGQDITLCHYAMRVFNKSHYGSWNLYSHSHNTLPDDPHILGIDVGVDCHNYKPISFEEVKIIMSKKLWMPMDRHGAKREEAGGIGLSRDEYMKEQRRTLYLQLKREFGAFEA